MLFVNLINRLLSNAVTTCIKTPPRFIKIIIHFFMVKFIIYLLRSCCDYLSIIDTYNLILPISLCIVKLLINLRTTKNIHSLFSVKYILVVFLRSLLITLVFIPLLNGILKHFEPYLLSLLFKYSYVLMIVLYILDLFFHLKDLIPKPYTEWGIQYYEGKGKRKITQEDEDNDEKIAKERRDFIRDLVETGHEDSNEEVEKEKKELITTLFETEDDIEALESLEEKSRTASSNEEFNKFSNKWDEVAGKVNRNMHKLEDLQDSLNGKEVQCKSLKEKYEELASRFDKNQADHYEDNDEDSEDHSNSE